MAYIPKQAVDGTYTTADDSTFARATADIAALGKTNFFRDYVEKNYMDYFSGIPLVEVVKDGVWLDQATSIEAGENPTKWDASEFEKADHGQSQEGHTTSVTPSRIVAGLVISTSEMAREKSITDERFEKLMDAKKAIPLDNISKTIISRFQTEVLNKIDDDAGTYLSPDGFAVISDNHVNANGENAWDNEFVAAGADIDAKVEDFLDQTANYVATSVDSGGNTLDMQIDTFLVAAGSDIFKSITQYYNQVTTLAKIGASDVSDFFKQVSLYPQTSSQVAVYQGEGVNIVAIKGMATDLILGMDITKPAPIKFKVTQDFRMYEGVRGLDGSMSYLIEGFAEFWAKEIPRYICGGRIS